jgi:branched-chain amino acid transport system ATP-binding protein
MRAIAGSLPLRAGSILFGGEDVGRMRPSVRVDRGLVLVPEGRMIFPRLTVEENLRLGAIAPHARHGQAARMERIYALFPRLAERRRQHGGTLSGGEQQMLALGRGLMAAPRLLLLDEPTLGIAPILADFIFETVGALRREGMTILIAEQDIARTLQLADRGYVIENGRIALEGSAAALLGDPRVREAYLGI